MPDPITDTPPELPTRRLAALGSRDFRLLWVGQMISLVGSQMQLTTINWHIHQLLQGQTFAVGLLGRSFTIAREGLGLGALGLANVVPIVIFALIGGMLADSRDRRRLMLATQSAMALSATVLAVITLTGHDSIWAIYLLSGATAAAQAFNNPAQQSLIPHLVSRAQLTNAISLNTLNWQLGTIIGPALAGILLAHLGEHSTAPNGWIYLINGLSFLTVILAVAAMHYRGKPAVGEGQGGQGVGWKAMLEGLRFVRRTHLIRSSMLLDFFATLFASARYILPMVAHDILHVGVAGYGLLNAAQPVGAVLAGSVMALKHRLSRQGVVLLVCVALYGVATMFFGLSTSFALSYFFFALTGAADTISTVIRGTMRQMLTPDHLRGRMVGVNMVFFMGGPQLGELTTGLLAAALGAPFAIVSGGVATVILAGWVAWKDPELRSYEG